MRPFRLGVVSLALAGVACGLGLSGTSTGPSATPGEGDEAGVDGAADAANGGDGSSFPIPMADADAADAAMAADAAACEAICGAFLRTCNDAGACTRTCTMASPCSDTVCPPGVPCEITCMNANACNAISCGTASSCTVHCQNANACINGVYLSGSVGALNGVGNLAAPGNVICCASTCNIMCPGNDCGPVCCKTSMCNHSGGGLTNTCLPGVCP
jgi:hypothetical protein